MMADVFTCKHDFVFSFRGEVVLNLQKFQIQPMDTLNAEHLQLLILTANPNPENQSTENTSSLPYSNNPSQLTVSVPSSNDVVATVVTDATAIVSEDATMFLQESVADATVSESCLLYTSPSPRDA